MQSIQSEEDFEISHTLAVEHLSPSNQMRTPSDATKNSNSVLGGVVDGLNDIIGSPIVSSEASAAEGAVGGQAVVVPGSPLQTNQVPLGVTKRTLDRINNLVQKEESLSKAGVTRYKYMLRIAEALDAVKVVEYRDSSGNVRYRNEPDVARNQWGVDQAAKLYGDMIERKEIEHDLGDKTLDRFRSLSVAELKARAADLLLGKPVSRLTPLGPVVDI